MANNKTSNMSLNVFFDTLGCAKNSVDTSKMEELLINGGINVVSNAEIADALNLSTSSVSKILNA